MIRRRSQADIITGIDIGSSSIRIAVGQVTEDERLGHDLQVIAAAEVSSGGIQKGSIVSIEEAVSAVSHVLEDVERLIGVPIESAWIGISGTQTLTQASRGAVAVAKSDGEISAEDVARVIEAAQTIASPLNYEVLHVLPKSYVVDGQMGIKDPVGMTGVRLEADAQIMYGATPYVKNVMKAVYRTGIDIDDLVVGILATAEVVLMPRQKELGVALIDIGATTTTVAVYEEGNLLHVGVVPLGADHITNDIALGLQTSIDVAERVKLTYGQCDPKGLSKKDLIDLEEFQAPPEKVSQKFVTEIIHARVSEILERIDAELDKVERRAMLPAGVVFTGGGAKLHGLADAAKSLMGMNAGYGFPSGIQSATEKVNDLAFATAFGLVSWGARADLRSAGRSRSRAGGSGAQVATHMKRIFKFLIP